MKEFVDYLGLMLDKFIFISTFWRFHVVFTLFGSMDSGLNIVSHIILSAVRWREKYVHFKTVL